MTHLELTIEGMTCQHCVRAVRSRLEHTDGVTLGEVAIGSATLDYDPAKVSVGEIESALADEGYAAKPK